MSMRPMFKLWTRIGALIVACAFVLLYLQHQRAVSGNEGVDPSQRQAEVAPTKPKGNPESPSSTAPIEAGRAKVEPSRAKAEPIRSAVPAVQINFRYADGTPAANLGLYRADSTALVYEHAILRGAPTWTHHLGPAGELDLAQALELGTTVAVRLSDCSVELVPFDPVHVREYELVPVVEQEFVLGGLSIGREVTAVLNLNGMDSYSFGSDVDLREDPDRAGFADHFSVKTRTNGPAIVAALTRLRLTSSKPSVHIRLPAGEYRLETLSCTVGTWVSTDRVKVDGTPIPLELVPLPITDVILPEDPAGNVRVPEHVRVFVATKAYDGNAGSSFELELEFEVHGDHLSIGERWRDTAVDGHHSTYALKFYWPDGTNATTRPGDWESLLQTVDFSRP